MLIKQSTKGFICCAFFSQKQHSVNILNILETAVNVPKESV